MLELIVLLTLAALAIGAVALVGFLFKIVFKVALIPVWIVLGLLKIVLGIVAAVLGLAVAILGLVFLPLAFVLFLVVGLPLLALAGLLGLGWTAIAA